MKYFLKNRSLLFRLIVVVATSVVYSFSLHGEFHFDDLRRIVGNPALRDLSKFWPPYQGRYLVDLSFAINYQISGLDTLSYHLVNVLIHIINAILVYALLRLTFQRLMDGTDEKTEIVAFAGSLVFALHPLQTQAVSYIVQRYASGATMFYLLALYLYIRWRQTERLHYWIGLLLSLLAAMHSKEIAFTAPFAILLYELVFFKERPKRVKLYLVPVVLTAFVIPFEKYSHLLFGKHTLPQAPVVSEEGVSIPHSHYVFTQFRVLLTYLRLFFIPLNQMVDYDYPLYRSFFEPAVLASLVVLLGLLTAAVRLLILSRKTLSYSPLRVTAFGVLFFFLGVSVESFLVSLPHVIFEHRMYLPSVGVVFALCGLLGFLFEEKKVSKNLLWGGTLAVVVLLSAFTIQRNLLWRTEIALWQDNVEKAPMRTAPHYHLAVAYERAGKLQEALKQMLWASRLSPDYPVIYFHLGGIYEKLQNPDKAIDAYKAALKLDPEYLSCYIKLGNIYYRSGRFQEALHWYEKALSLEPQNPTILYNLSLTKKMIEALKKQAH